MARRYPIGGAMGVLLVAIGTLTTALAGQDRPRIWLGAGLGGAGGSDARGGGALMAEIIYQTGVHHFGVRALGAADPFGYSGDEFGEVGVVYGRSATRPWGHAAIAAGLAWTGFGSCQGSGGCSTVGVPVVAEVAARLFSIMGVGAQAFGNLNTKSVYLGAVLFLQLGWLP
jgi:hypothetical protein